MAKALFCLTCGAVKTFAPDGATTKCDCADGQVVGWWVDTSVGLARMAVLPPGIQEQARVVLMHSRFLRADVDDIPKTYAGPDGTQPHPEGQIDAFWRHRHDDAQDVPLRPEVLQPFHRSKRACPLVIQRVGTSADTLWATELELRDRGLLEVSFSQQNGEHQSSRA